MQHSRARSFISRSERRPAADFPIDEHDTASQDKFDVDRVGDEDQDRPVKAYDGSYADKNEDGENCSRDDMRLRVMTFTDGSIQLRSHRNSYRGANNRL